MVTASGHAYPWDVLGDPEFPGRVRRAGLGTVTLAATYHSTRAATPLHPHRQVVDARYAALYRPVRPEAWDGHLLTPAAPDWLAEPDPFGAAAGLLRAAGLKVTAWIVLTHSTRLGLAHPRVAVVNCFGESYPYALCPAHPEVRRYAATLAAEALRGAPVDAVSLEACGQLGVDHLGHHEKTAGAWTAEARRLLSVCCCAACRAAWRAAGADDEALVAALRRGARTAGAPPFDDAVLLAVRQAHTDALRAEVLAAVRAAAPGVPVTLHASPDPWATGPSPGLTPSAADDVDALLVPAWPTGPETAELVAAAAKHGRPVDAYVTVLSDADGETLVAHARRLRDAGASRLSLYHLGLAPAWRQVLFGDVLDAVR
ncbi:hypothetical protein [Spirilliplanes yamanashiensis]|uniref:Alanine-rich protein n=1 Tax=Spirilliplanes yamanashiensis TaxID=42233 RepID=A0A8J3YCK6_9ACTN|nr:hypothetical protein [Spirilliplanes yamanashiensis]MDP9819040.1 hypothetical protein [Spirilliplanes yamanashiensis]GIJ05495.1 hypothetical protein Sya03_48470 [Spirilliplanes yamanashiensis]